MDSLLVMNFQARAIGNLRPHLHGFGQIFERTCIYRKRKADPSNFLSVQKFVRTSVNGVIALPIGPVVRRPISA